MRPQLENIVANGRSKGMARQVLPSECLATRTNISLIIIPALTLDSAPSLAHI